MYGVDFAGPGRYDVYALIRKESIRKEFACIHMVKVIIFEYVECIWAWTITNSSYKFAWSYDNHILMHLKRGLLRRILNACTT